MPRRTRRSQIGNTPRTVTPLEQTLPLPEEVARAFPIPGPTVIPIDDVQGNGQVPAEQPEEEEAADIPNREPTFSDDFGVGLQYVRSLRFHHMGATEELTPALMIMLLAELREQRYLLGQLLSELSKPVD